MNRKLGSLVWDHYDVIRDGGRSLTAERLETHLLKTHLHPETLLFEGVPRFDIELSQYLGIKLPNTLAYLQELGKQPDKQLYEKGSAIIRRRIEQTHEYITKGYLAGVDVEGVSNDRAFSPIIFEALEAANLPLDQGEGFAEKYDAVVLTLYQKLNSGTLAILL